MLIRFVQSLLLFKQLFQWLSLGFALVLAGSTLAAENRSLQPTILVLGDSLSAAYGIDQASGWVNLLQQRLQAQDFHYEVMNASISGETSHGGLNRLPVLLDRYQPEILIIELGANDGLRGLPLNALQQNLEAMIQLAQKNDAQILLLGMELPPNYGPAYTRAFQTIYKQLAEQYKTALIPFLLDGIATQRQLMQDDNLHPVAAAQALVLNNVWPSLQPLLNKTTDR